MTGSALDALKDSFWQVRGKLDYVIDYLGGHDVLEDDHHVFDFLDNLVQFTAERLGEFVPGISWDGRVVMTEEAWTASRTYDDGTWVIVQVTLDNGHVADFRPRFDGDFNEWMQLFEKLPHVSEVES